MAFKDRRPTDMQVPEAGLAPFPISGAAPNVPFAAGKSWVPQRFTLAAATKRQVYQNSIACQYVVVLNEGGGDLVVGIVGVSPTAPTAGQSPQAAFSLVSGAALTIPIEDPSLVWVASTAGTTVSVAIILASYVTNAQYQVTPNYAVVPK